MLFFINLFKLNLKFFRVNLRDSKGFIFPPLLIARYATIVLTANIEETYLNTELKVEYSIPGDNTAYAIEVFNFILKQLNRIMKITENLFLGFNRCLKRTILACRLFTSLESSKKGWTHFSWN